MIKDLQDAINTLVFNKTILDEKTRAEINESLEYLICDGFLKLNNPTEEDVQTVYDVVHMHRETVRGPNIAAIVQMMKHHCREQTRGAAELEKVFITDTLYQKIREILDDHCSSKISIAKVLLVECPLLVSKVVLAGGGDKDRIIVGIATPKIKPMSAKKLIVIGKIENPSTVEK